MRAIYIHAICTCDVELQYVPICHAPYMYLRCSPALPTCDTSCDRHSGHVIYKVHGHGHGTYISGHRVAPTLDLAKCTSKAPRRLMTRHQKRDTCTCTRTCTCTSPTALSGPVVSFSYQVARLCGNCTKNREYGYVESVLLTVLLVA